MEAGFRRERWSWGGEECRESLSDAFAVEHPPLGDLLACDEGASRLLVRQLLSCAFLPQAPHLPQPRTR